MHPFRSGRVTRISTSWETKKMKANFSINDIIHIQVVSRLADLLFDPAPENRCTRRTPQRSAHPPQSHRKRRRYSASHPRPIARNPRRGYRFARRQLKKLTESAQMLTSL